jgi:hypothetical protein
MLEALLDHEADTDSQQRCNSENSSAETAAETNRSERHVIRVTRDGR